MLEGEPTAGDANLLFEKKIRLYKRYNFFILTIFGDFDAALVLVLSDDNALLLHTKYNLHGVSIITIGSTSSTRMYDF